MANKQNIDEKIARLVQSVETDISTAVEEKLKAAAEMIRPVHRIQRKQLSLFLGIMTSAAMILFALLFLSPLFQAKSEHQITEIRTEFELRDKNIKIIFIQRHDFNLFKEER